MKKWKKVSISAIQIFIVLAVACLLIYRLSRGVLIGNDRYQTRQFHSLQNMMIENANLKAPNTLVTTTDDSQIIIKNVDQYIQNVCITTQSTIKNDADKVYAIQVFYDTGSGFNKDGVVSAWAKPGENRLIVDCPKKVLNLRIDPTNLANQQMTIGDITINQKTDWKPYALLFLIDAAFLLFIMFFYTRKFSNIEKAIVFCFYAAVSYIADWFLLQNAPVAYKIVMVAILGLLLYITWTLREGVNEIGRQTDKKHARKSGKIS